MAIKKDYVRIQSNINIQVTGGLQNDDVTRTDSDIPDRLKVSPQWPNLVVMIHQGAGVYPSEIVDWPTVKSLARDKVITIGQYLDSPESEADAATKRTIAEAIETEQKKKKQFRLADVSEEA